MFFWGGAVGVPWLVQGVKPLPATLALAKGSCWGPCGGCGGHEGVKSIVPLQAGLQGLPSRALRVSLQPWENSRVMRRCGGPRAPSPPALDKGPLPGPDCKSLSPPLLQGGQQQTKMERFQTRPCAHLLTGETGKGEENPAVPAGRPSLASPVDPHRAGAVWASVNASREEALKDARLEGPATDPEN